MKFALTISEATESEILRVMSLLSGSTAPIAITPQPMAPAPVLPMPTNTGDDDGDENGPANPNAPAVDSAGLPWDERIHSSNKQQTDKGVWRKRRGVADALVSQVEAELRARTVPTQPAPMFTDPPAPQPVMPQPMAPAPVAMIPMPTQQPMQTAPVPMPMPTAAAPVMQPQPVQQPAAAAAPSMDFPTFMQALSGQMQKRDGNGMPLIDTDYLARLTSEVATAFGTPLSVITDIVSQQRAAEMIVYAVQCMQRDQKWS